MKLSHKKTFKKKMTAAGPSKFAANMRQKANLEESENYLYDYVYNNKSHVDYPNKTIAYNKLYAKNLNKDEQPLHSEFIPHKPYQDKPENTRPYKPKRTQKAGRKIKTRKYRK